ncbi:PE-PGRS family protein [Streptomyces seoulensis]|nr:PE-PGRS family protein [Streptomyces seoulensis]
MNRTAIGLAVGAGYLLGRTKKLKMAVAVGSLVAGKKLNLTPRGVAELVSNQLKDNPQFKEIGDQLRQDMRGVGKAASGAMVERQMSALADRLQGRTAKVRDGLAGVVPDGGSKGAGRKGDEGAEEEYEDDYDDREGREADTDSEDSEDSEESEEESADGSRKAAGRREGGSARKAAAKAPAKKTAPAKRAARSEEAGAPARKTVKKAAKKAPAKKTVAKKTAAGQPAAKKTAASGGARRTSGTRTPKDGGDR